MDTQKTINKFRGDFEYLSNFYRQAPFESDDGAVWKTVEHYYQAAKTFHPTYRNNIYMAATPSDAKFLGSRCPLRKDWFKIKERIMYKAVFMKFIQNMDIAKKLVSTQGLTLIEGNTWHDNWWGYCKCDKCSKDNSGLPGLNKLGITLMRVRNDIIRDGDLLIRICKET